MNKVDIGIIGAMDTEVNNLIAMLEEHTESIVGSILFHRGRLYDKEVVIAKCGIGKVFAALCAEAMIITYAPRLIVNTGVGGAIKEGISVTDVVVAEKLVQHDMDTSAIGDPKGLVSGVNMIYFPTDERAREIARKAAENAGVRSHLGIIASGDLFVSRSEEKERIASEFSASVCEMEGAAIGQVAYVNKTPVCVVRAVSDSADEGSSMDYMEFLPIAAKNSTKITLELCKNY